MIWSLCKLLCTNEYTRYSDPYRSIENYYYFMICICIYVQIVFIFHIEYIDTKSICLNFNVIRLVRYFFHTKIPFQTDHGDHLRILIYSCFHWYHYFCWILTMMRFLFCLPLFLYSFLAQRFGDTIFYHHPKMYYGSFAMDNFCLNVSWIWKMNFEIITCYELRTNTYRPHITNN